MAVSLTGFDATQVEPSQDFSDPLPADWYRVAIVDAEMKQNSAQAKDPNGEQLVFTLQVTDGPYKGRKAWDHLNLINANPDAARIARETLSSVCHAVGVLQPNDTDELIGIDMMVRVIVENGNNGPRNNVKAYKSLKDYKPAGAPAAAPAGQPSFAQNSPAAQQQPQGAGGFAPTSTAPAASKPGPSWAH